MDNSQLAARSDENYFESMAALAEAVSGRPATWEPGLVLASCRSPIQLFNSAFLTAGGPAVDGLLQRATDFFAAEGVPFVLRCREGLYPDLADAAAQMGLARVDDLPGMAIEIPPAPAMPTDLDLRVATNQDELDAHLAVLAPAFGIEPKVAAHLFPPSSIETPGTTMFVGYIDGKPVTTSLVTVTGDTAGVYNVATHVDYRGRGLGEAATWGALSAGREAGATVGILQASDMGRPIYERMGFRVVAPYQQYMSS